jgi:hypothetical protein
MNLSRLRIATPTQLKLSLFILSIIALPGCQNQSKLLTTDQLDHVFNGERALQDVIYQVELGPRIPGCIAHALTVEWIRDRLIESGWSVDIQETKVGEIGIQNILAQDEGEDPFSDPFVLIGAHYDSRINADRDPDPDNHKKPVPGANDGASGVAVLLEFARTIPLSERKQVQLAFFDAEDNGNIPGWDWILGSTAYVADLDTLPACVVIIDMVGDSDLNIYRELNSDPRLTDGIWKVAAKLGYGDKFLNTTKYRILDDHIPFLNAGVPSVDIIDFDYPYWHTSEDTPDKVSSESLQSVGETLMEWLNSTTPCQNPF